MATWARNDPPVHAGNYWSNLAQLVRMSVRPPYPGLPKVTQGGMTGNRTPVSLPAPVGTAYGSPGS